MGSHHRRITFQMYWIRTEFWSSRANHVRPIACLRIPAFDESSPDEENSIEMRWLAAENSAQFVPNLSLASQQNAPKKGRQCEAHLPTGVRATLGNVAAGGDGITVWCKNPVCGYWREHGRQYRAVLTAADLATYAERYGAATTFVDFRARLRRRYRGSGDVNTIVGAHHVTPQER
jgi:hypothetical protein